MGQLPLRTFCQCLTNSLSQSSYCGKQYFCTLCTAVQPSQNLWACILTCLQTTSLREPIIPVASHAVVFRELVLPPPHKGGNRVPKKTTAWEANNPCGSAKLASLLCNWNIFWLKMLQWRISQLHQRQYSRAIISSQVDKLQCFNIITTFRKKMFVCSIPDGCW